ncbi:MATE family efflux transporter [Luteibacter sahnii]|uniref:MATE family efflux transporter n=1 Tax=Luteibacter sahnii TaxID=3021977 RepID=UPI002A6A65FD|nr:MATE family efflux transporter [Luteibacter sp. PPL193]MDY1549759.1 MATE family efflux transporter [Luteibacter sp. PPL193]
MNRPADHALVEGPITRTLLLFALPMLGTNVLQSLNASINVMWVGRYLGEAAFAATANATLVLFFLLGLVLGIGIATTILVGQALGARDVDAARRIVGTGLSFFMTVSLVVSVAGYFATPALLHAMGTPADARPYAIDYLRIIFLALPFMYLYTFLMMVLRGAGDSRTPFAFMIVSVVLDIALNPLFIFGAGPVPSLGIAGSAVATLIAQGLSLGGLVAWMYARKHFLCLRAADARLLLPEPAILKALVLKGLPMGAQMLVITSSAIIMMSLVNGHGSQTTAAYGAAVQLWNYIQMPAFAVGMAVSSMVAQNVGAKRWDRVATVGRVGILASLGLTGVLVLVVYAFAGGAAAIFLGSDSTALGIARHLNAVVVWSYLLFGVTFVLFGVVRATGAVMMPLVALAVSMWGVRYPFALLLEPSWGADAIWWSFPVSSVVSLGIAAVYYHSGRWRRATMMPASAAA